VHLLGHAGSKHQQVEMVDDVDKGGADLASLVESNDESGDVFSLRQISASALTFFAYGRC
jgi:hypothetical protein